jgi:glutamate synthase (NADPH/NADH) large chain
MSERKSNTGSGEREAARHPGYAAPFIGSTAAPGTPPAQGLYDPALDKDSCGVGFIADIKGRT